MRYKPGDSAFDALIKYDAKALRLPALLVPRPETRGSFGHIDVEGREERRGEHEIRFTFTARLAGTKIEGSASTGWRPHDEPTSDPESLAAFVHRHEAARREALAKAVNDVLEIADPDDAG